MSLRRVREIEKERKQERERGGERRGREWESAVGVSIHFPALPRVAAALFYETN